MSSFRVVASVTVLFILLNFLQSPHAVYSASTGLDVGKLDRGLRRVIDDYGYGEIPVIVLFNSGKDKRSLHLEAEHDYDLIDAVALEVDRRELSRLSTDPGVKKIFFDHKVQLIEPSSVNGSRARLSTSVDAIAASRLHQLGFTGRNVTVAVVDTGIDYTHPDLGGCLGAGCRVVAGYDFSNSDSDPMDDHGHGTHCAGIVGANGTITGVAPEASFMAVKVLDSGGSGSESDVMAGVDYAVGWGADVVSLSLGGSAQPNDGLNPMDLIIDAAVDRGVVVAVAVGNEGPGTGTVAMPADAHKVLSVGASDDKDTVSTSDDTVAGFSCRGPSAFGRLDPDVVAPGVAIYSTKPGSSYDTLTGTSMSTPHVAGAAALMLDYNPGWTVDEIRSRLMHTATSLTGYHVFEQGPGEINVSKAVFSNVDARVDGTQLYWGDSVVPGLNATAVLTILNQGNNTVGFNFSVGDLTDLEGDKNISSQSFQLPAPFSVEPGTSTNATVYFISAGDEAAGVYGSRLVLMGNDSSVLTVPVVFTVALSGDDFVNGTVDDSCSGAGCSQGINPQLPVYDWGDWIFYKVQTPTKSLLTASLAFDNDTYDLDMFLFDGGGELVSIAGSLASPEVINADVYGGSCWIAIRAYTTGYSNVVYNLSVTYNSSLSVQPSVLQETVAANSSRNLTLTVVNNDAAKNDITLSLKSLGDLGSEHISGALPPASSTSMHLHSGWNLVSLSTLPGSLWYSVWNKTVSDLNQSLDYLTALLEWSNSSVDLGLRLSYINSTGYLKPTRYSVGHNNQGLNESFEVLEDVDIEYYMRQYSGLGLEVENSNSVSQDFNLTVNLTALEAVDYATVQPDYIPLLSPNESVNVTLDVNASGLVEDVYSTLLVIEDNSTEYASVPVELRVNTPTETTSTTATTSTTVTTATTTTSTTTTTTTTSTTSVTTTSTTSSTTLSQIQIEYINPVSYTGEYTYELNFTGSLVYSLDLYVPSPANWSSQRDVNLTSYSPGGSVQSETVHGNRFIHFDETHLSSGVVSTNQTFIFTAYEVNVTNLYTGVTADYDNSSLLYQNYTRNENKLEKDYFVNITPGIVGGEQNPVQKARRIYDYVVANMTYELQGGVLQGAVFAYENRTGECGDYSALFVAMARSVGIPARPVAGFWADSIYGSTHVWAEFYIQDIGWIPADPERGQGTGDSDAYFGHLDNKRLVMSKNFNIGLDGRNTTLLQVGAYWWTGLGNNPSTNFQYNRK